MTLYGSGRIKSEMYFLQQIAECHPELHRLLFTVSTPFGRELSRSGHQRLLQRIFTVKNDSVWRLRGKLHRSDGPAGISYHNDGTIDREEWWENGKQVV